MIKLSVPRCRSTKWTKHRRIIRGPITIGKVFWICLLFKLDRKTKSALLLASTSRQIAPKRTCRQVIGKFWTNFTTRVILSCFRVKIHLFGTKICLYLRLRLIICFDIQSQIVGWISYLFFCLISSLRSAMAASLNQRISNRYLDWAIFEMDEIYYNADALSSLALTAISVFAGESNKESSSLQ